MEIYQIKFDDRNLPDMAGYKMTDYSKSKIYRINSKNTDRYYIGSTVQPLRKVLTGHKRLKDSPSKQILDMKDVDIILIEEFECKTKEELNTRCEEIIKQHPLCINELVDKKEKKEHLKELRHASYERNKDTSQEYYETNKDKILAQRKEKITCECGSVISRRYITDHNKSIKHQDWIKGCVIKL